ncbi:condensin complex protein MksE [Flocculibacter collagenilyticus]|uniref:condensin complex protein MksE n=1 Tax=Flocculibacter collagenilyticus TaxID=2744479 RepID=UPI0018F45A3A|nr:hypothetical protein [Flocculibacter collagenilyticus]
MINQQGQVLELLLSGQFICQVSDEEAYRYLQNTAHQSAIEAQLNVMNRTLATAAEGEVFYCAYQVLGDSERKVLTSQFQDVSSHLMPLVEWLLLVQEANGSDMLLTQGASIRLNEFQTIVEDTPAFSEQIAKIARYAMFGSKSNELDAQLKQVFKRLVELGYLIKPNPDKQIYLATGKVDYLFDVIKFIDETETLSLAERAEEAISQTSLI